jgi:hypothetical protein
MKGEWVHHKFPLKLPVYKFTAINRATFTPCVAAQPGLLPFIQNLSETDLSTDEMCNVNRRWERER